MDRYESTAIHASDVADLLHKTAHAVKERIVVLRIARAGTCRISWARVVRYGIARVVRREPELLQRLFSWMPLDRQRPNLQHDRSELDTRRLLSVSQFSQALLSTIQSRSASKGFAWPF